MTGEQKMTKEQKYNYKFSVDLNRLLIKKTTCESEINKVGNKIWRLENERLKWQQERARTEKEIRSIVIKHNDMEFIKSDKKTK